MTDDQAPNIMRHSAPVGDGSLPEHNLIGEANLKALETRVSEVFGSEYQVFHELISMTIHLDILAIASVPDRMPFQLLMTSGMSSRAMTLPPGRSDPLYAELMLALPPDWPLDSVSLDQERWYWPIRWLKFLARLPHDYLTYLVPGHTVPTDDPPEPVAPGLDFTGFLIGESRFFSAAFTRVPVKGYKHQLHLLSVYPVTTAEMDFKLERGMQTFVETIWNKMSEVVDVRRDSWIT